MCTASNYITDKHYFGRNFDYEISYNERVTITPRNYEFKYRKIDDVKSHYAIIGIAAGIDEYPLYYDACNEKGLSIAGLNFEGNAVYNDCENNMINIAPFELIPYILSSASTHLQCLKPENYLVKLILLTLTLPMNFHYLHFIGCCLTIAANPLWLNRWKMD